MSESDNLKLDILKFISDNKKGVSSSEIASRFFNMKYSAEVPATAMIRAIVSSVVGCTYDNGLWKMSGLSDHYSIRSLFDAGFAGVYFLESAGTVYHVSVFTVEHESNKLFSGWFKSPDELSSEERNRLVAYDEEFVSRERTVADVVSALNGLRPIFLSYRQQQIAMKLFIENNCTVFEEAFLLSYFMGILNVKVPSPLTLEAISSSLLDKSVHLTTAQSYGYLFASIMTNIFKFLLEHGISTMEELFSAEKSVLADWSNMNFTREMALNLNNTPGVYGFKNSAGEFIYIGKAKRIKNRILRYYRETDGSPQKLINLRSEATDLIVHYCGSELEALVYEQRLIEKYLPKYNRKIEYNERIGSIKEFPDLILFLPHRDERKVMSFWFRSGQRLKLFPLSENERVSVSEIEAFFYSERLEPDKGDFIELEIFSRWFSQNRDNRTIINISDFENAEEVSKAIGNAVNNFQEV